VTSANLNPIILYDGVCGLCSRSVKFILKRDRRDVFHFASLQSDFAAQILRRHGVNPETLDTMYVVLGNSQSNERLLARSDAAAFIVRQLGGVWKIAGVTLSLVPRWLREWAYRFVARHRYRVFGKYQACMIPEAKQRAKFLDEQAPS
jgi:predicted DCC family thiol-disulfide oxidoreductase YuxK